MLKYSLWGFCIRRSFTHWLGGMGVLVFLLAITSFGGGEGHSLHLLRAESPGPDVGKITPKLRQGALTLYVIYIALSIIEVILLLCGGMPLFDSLCTMFGTAGTGGFSIKNASMAAYPSAYLQNVVTIFMALFGVNFSIFFLLFMRDFSQVLHDEELRLLSGNYGQLCCTDCLQHLFPVSILESGLSSRRFSGIFHHDYYRLCHC